MEFKWTKQKRIKKSMEYKLKQFWRTQVVCKDAMSLNNMAAGKSTTNLRATLCVTQNGQEHSLEMQWAVLQVIPKDSGRTCEK